MARARRAAILEVDPGVPIAEEQSDAVGTLPSARGHRGTIVTSGSKAARRLTTGLYVHATALELVRDPPVRDLAPTGTLLAIHPPTSSNATTARCTHDWLHHLSVAPRRPGHGCRTGPRVARRCSRGAGGRPSGGGLLRPRAAAGDGSPPAQRGGSRQPFLRPPTLERCSSGRRTRAKQRPFSWGIASGGPAGGTYPPIERYVRRRYGRFPSSLSGCSTREQSGPLQC